MSQFLFYLLAFLLVIGILVVIHELGHYLVARWCGVRILCFSVGFGPTLWKRSFGPDQTKWAIAALPLGGYVRMLDEREGEVDPAERHRAFNTQSVGKRSLIVAAGPLANFLLAFVLYWGLFWQGGETLLPVLGSPPAQSVAAKAGILDGERVRRIDDEATASWGDFRWVLLQKAVDQDVVTLELENPEGQLHHRRLPLTMIRTQGWEGDVLDQLGLRLYRPRLAPRIGTILSGSPAARAGLREGDQVRACNGQAVTEWGELVQAIRQAGNQDILLEIQREGAQDNGHVTVRVRPENNRIGIGVAASGLAVLDRLRAVVRYDPLTAARKAWRETWDKARFSLQMLGKMFSGEVSWRNLSGPVSIADYAGQSASMGLSHYLSFLALVSVSLGVLNLLPIPVLDGGHLLYYTFEVIRGRPLSGRVLAWTQKVGLFILLTLMAFAFFNDLNRLFSG